MPHRIPQSIAIRVPLRGYLSLDGRASAVGLDPSVTISRNGAGFANPSAGATVATEIGNGWYYVDLSTTDTGTLGPLVIYTTHTTMDPIEIVYQIVNANTMGAAGIPDALPGANNGVTTTNGTKQNQTVDLTAGQSIVASNMRGTDNALTDKAGFSLSATGADLILKSSTFVQAIVAAVNELATYGLTALNTLLVTTGIKTVSTAPPTDMALNSTVAKETTLATVAGYIDTEIGTIITAVGTTIPNAIAALPTDADVNAACDTAISDAAIPSTLATAHGAGSWESSIVVPAIQSQAYYATASQQRDITIMRGDTPTLIFSLGGGYVGYTARFGAKVSTRDPLYVIGPKDCSWADAANETCSVALTKLETATLGKFFSEIEVRNGDLISTALRFFLIVVDDVIK